MTYAGKGSFVAGKNLDLIREEHLRQIEELFCRAKELADQSGLANEELYEMLRLTCEGD